MGFWDTQEYLTSAWFKKDDADRTVFYPWGVLGRGYVLPDEETERKVRRAVGFQMSSLFATGLLAVCVSPYVLCIVAVAVAWYWYEMRELVAGLPVSQRKLTLRESFASPYLVRNRVLAWLLFVASILLFAIGILFIVPALWKDPAGMDATGWLIGIGWIVGTGAFVLGYGYVLKVSYGMKAKGSINRPPNSGTAS